MKLKKIYVVVLLSASVVSYAMNESKETYSFSPELLAFHKHYLEVELPNAAFGEGGKKTKNAKEIIESYVQYQNTQIKKDRRFGKGSSGKDAKL